MAFFYCNDITHDTLVLSPEESHHCTKALRKREGDTLSLTDGKGTIAEAVVTIANLKQCVVQVVQRKVIAPRPCRLHIAVAPTKNADRIEWFVEKAVEIGIEKITLLLCDHSERTKVDIARLERIAIAALKQSQTAILPAIETLAFSDLLLRVADTPCEKYIAWCDCNNHRQLALESITAEEVLVLIGPEGDFSQREIEQCKAMGFKEVKLGERRLRTETAALYSCFCIAALNLTNSD